MRVLGGAAFFGLMGLPILGLTIWLGGGAAHATDPLFLGRWAIDPAGCKVDGDTAETAPLVLTDTSVKWFVSSCTIKKSYRIGDGLYLQAQCWSEGRSRVMPIGLQLKGESLTVTWDQTRVGEMRRCR